MLPENFMKIKDELERNIKYPEIREILGQKVYFELGEIQRVIINDMVNGSGDKDVQRRNRDDIECIIENLQELENIVILKPLDEMVKKYITDLLLLLKNWNDNTEKSEKIYRLIEGVVNIITLHLSLKDSIRVNQMICRELMKYRSFKPAAYDTALHYMKNLEENIENRRILNERNK